MTHKFLTKKEDIIDWLNSYDIKKYKLIEHHETNNDGSLKYGFVVDVNKNVDLTNNKLTRIPVKFNIIKGDFDCANNELTTLDGCPEIVHGDFICHSNELTTLYGCPNAVHGNFYCPYNNLTTLQGCPKEVNGTFDCRNNNLTNLKGCPNEVHWDFWCNSNKLTTLEFIAEKVDGNFFCNDNYELGYIQEITDFNEIKQISNAIKEQKILNNELSIFNNKKDIIKV